MLLDISLGGEAHTGQEGPWVPRTGSELGKARGDWPGRRRDAGKGWRSVFRPKIRFYFVECWYSLQ